MRKMKKFARGGSTDRAKARMDRRMADIEKDYQRAIAKGKSEREAKAKRDQRIADARDDYAKRTGADRTETRAAEKAAEAKLKAVRRGVDKDIKPLSVTAEGSKPLATAKVDMPEVKTPEVGASSGRQTFSQAFAAARRSGAKTFTWNGKSYTTEMRGEGRSSTPARGSGRSDRSSNGSGAASRERSNPLAQYEREKARREGTTGLGIAVTASRAQVEAAKADARKKAAAYLAKQQQAASDAAIRRGQRPAKFAAPTDAQLDRIANQQGFKKGGKVKKYAKGGVVKKSINGIAKRGLTRGARKK